MVGLLEDAVLEIEFVYLIKFELMILYLFYNSKFK